MKRFIEWYFGAPAAGPGESTRWEWSLRTPLSGGIPSWAGWVLILLAIGLVWFIYRRESRSLSRLRTTSLIALRLAVLGLVILLAADPTLVIRRTGLPSVALVVDDSASMQLGDVYGAEDRRAVQALLGSGQADTATRAQLAKALLTSNQRRFLKNLLDRYDVQAYRFAETVERLTPRGEVNDDSLDALQKRLRELEANGPQTRMGEALRFVLNESRGIAPAAIVLISDGISTENDETSLPAVAELAASRGIPIFTIALGSERRARDVELTNLQVDQLAFVNDPLQVTGHVRGAGYQGVRLPVTSTVRRLLDGDEAPTQVRSVDVQLTGENASAQFEHSITFDTPGEYELHVRAAGQAGEADLSNNEDVRHIKVLDRQIRVLLAETAPRWEYRYLKHVLEREPTIAASVLLLEADLGYAAEDRTALTHFPVREEELLAYDVIILGDIDAKNLSPRLLDSLQSFVGDVGGGMLLIAGPRSTPATFAETPLAPLVPVEFERIQGLHAPPGEGFRPVLTPQGAQGVSIFRMSEDSAESARFWNRVPEFRWMIKAERLKPGAVALLETAGSPPQTPPAPLISLQRYGAGQVMFHATDELWLWRHHAGDRYYGRYWIQAIRYLSRSRLLGSSGLIELTTARRVYSPGEEVVLTARQLGPVSTRSEQGWNVIVEDPQGERRPLVLSAVSGEEALFQGILNVTAEGRYRAWLSDQPLVSTSFRVDATPAEFRDRQARRGELAAAARRTGGRAYTLADAHELPGDLPPGVAVSLESDQRISLWSRGEALLLFMLLLAGEWLLRKRSHLL